MTKFKIPENTEFIEQTMENGMLITKFIPKEEELKDIKWRADKNKMYYAMDCTFEVCHIEDNRDVIDNGNFNASNYFRTEQECLAFCEKVNSLLNPNN